MKPVLALLLLGAAHAAEPSLHVFHFGNSLTGNSMPKWQPELGKSAGVEWQPHAWLGAGWQLWMHREQVLAKKDLFSAASTGALTLEPGLIESAPEQLKALYGRRWDAIVLQLFAPHLTEVTDRKGRREFDAARDFGDLGAASDLIRLQLARNPDSLVYLYQVWPPMERGEARDGKRGAEFPRRDKFDYAARWLQPYDNETSPGDRENTPWRSRAFGTQVIEQLGTRFPELAESGRLRMIPAGDLFLALDRKLRDGAAPGIDDIRDFYTDVQHIRAGLPRYSVAALMFACLFEQSPHQLDWKLYNQRAKYGPDRHNDIGELLEITPEHAKLVHDTILEVLADHPHAGVRVRDGD